MDSKIEIGEVNTVKQPNQIIVHHPPQSWDDECREFWKSAYLSFLSTGQITTEGGNSKSNSARGVADKSLEFFKLTFGNVNRRSHRTEMD